MKPAAPITWILIADAAHATVLTLERGRPELVPVPGMTFGQEIPAARDLERDRPARTHESATRTRHAIEPKADPRRALKRAFAEEIAERLDVAAVAKAFDRLVIAAPPPMLGDLRAALTRTVAERVVKELSKDLVKIPRGDLLGQLELPMSAHG